MNTPTYLELVLDRERPDEQVVLADATRELTTEQLRHEVYAVARSVTALGLERGTVVALVTENVCSAVTVRYAAQLLGLVTVYAPNGGDHARLATFLREVNARTIVTTAARAATVAAALRTDPGCAPCPRLLSSGSVDPAVLEVEGDLLAISRTVDGSRLPGLASPGDVCCLVSSGGTTGAPKASIRDYEGWAALVAGRDDVRRRQLVCTPLAYVAQVLTDQTLLGGGSVVLRPATVPFDARATLAAIEAQRITHLGLVEPDLVRLLDHPDLRRHDLRSLVGITHIGADACAALRTRMWLRLHSAGLDDVLVHAYGSSEVGMVSLLAGSDYSVRHPELLSTTGRPAPGVDVAIHDRDDRALPAGVAGEIVVSSPGVCSATTRFPDPWTDPAQLPSDHEAPGVRCRRTGDWGVLDASGRLTVRGRIADAVPADGELVFPVDVQESLCSEPTVRYAVALPSPSGSGFNAVVVLKPGARTTATELVRRTSGRLRLGRVVFCTELPLTEQGKPDRRALHELFAAEVASAS